MGSSMKSLLGVGNRFGLAALTSLAGALIFFVAPALAVAPETPAILPPFEVRAEVATFAGVLDPGKAGEPETYEKVKYSFFYRRSKTECKGAGSVATPLIESQGAGEETVAQGVEGLTKGTEYTVCLRAKGSGGEAVSAPMTFKTAIPPETPTGEEATAVAPTTATLNGVLNPHAAGDPGTFEFHYRQSASECEGEGEQAVEGASSGSSPEPVEAQITELLPGMSYTFCLHARNEAGEETHSEPVTFATPAVPPTIASDSESVSVVEATAVTVSAEVDPGGSGTSYDFEYGTTTAYGENTTPGTLAADDSLHAVQARITGLKPGTTYHYHVVAGNTPGSTPGPDGTFTTAALPATETCSNATLRTEQSIGLTLPDCRAYEMVSPIETDGQDATNPFVTSAPRAAMDGEAVVYTSKGLFKGTSAEPEGGTAEDQYLSRRGPSDWTTRSITPLHDPVKTESRSSYGATLFTPELAAGIANSNAPIGIEGPAGVFRIYYTDLESGAIVYVGEAEDALGASRDLGHVVFGSSGEVFESADGTIMPVNVDNSGALLSGSVGAVPHYANEEDAWQAVSSDGSRVYFSTPYREEEAEVGGLYVRVNAEQPQSQMEGEACIVPTDACTIEVSASARTVADAHGPQRPRYWGASASGSKVFFTSNAELTNDAYTGPEDNAPNLYEYEVSSEPGKTPGRLKDLTVDENEEGAAVKGVVQISEDGSYVYFVAEGQLAEGAAAGHNNLYVIHDGGEPKFIASLGIEKESEPVWRGQFYPGESGPEVNFAVLSPGGSRLAFVSEQELTGYDNAAAEEGECQGQADANTRTREHGECDEIYLYDAETGGLACPSCNPTGERPTGGASLGPAAARHSYAEYRSRNLLEDGTLFFDSTDSLTPHGSDGLENVYEFEDGQIHAISDTNGGHESFFIDAGADGRNVFFGTADQLVTQDKGENVVVYDARVEGGFPATGTPSTCLSGEACKPPPTLLPPLFGAPASATFSGAGNTAVLEPTIVPPVKKTAAQIRAERLAKAIKACRRDKSQKKRQACERSARKRYGPVKHKKGKKAATHASKRRTSR
jgi:hypothetical protein